ncbi:MAG: ribosome biogenesis GTPase Der [Chloroflexi bacterium]|nr:ribosome biogenesis GTPase Der [Chloroflexota bacterium]
MSSLVAIVGRPNVGKSTFFNRVVGKREAIVSPEPGTTRDRVYAPAIWRGKGFTLVDTGGLVTWGEDPLLRAVREQVEVAIQEAEAIIFVVDSQSGILPEDREIANILRRSGRAVILVANKAEGKGGPAASSEFYALGLGDPRPISALHGQGVGEVLDEVVSLLPSAVEEKRKGVRIAIVGRPNVGKSSLLNRLIGRQRAIVHARPGTTRDALDITFDWNKEEITLVDTAGIRRRGRIQPGIEKYSVIRALGAIESAEVAVLLLDAEQGILAQDTHIAGYVWDAGKGLVIAVNKWDLVPNPREARAQYITVIGQVFRFLPSVSILFISALTGEGVEKLLPEAREVYKQWRAEIPDKSLERVMKEAVDQHPPPSKGGRRLEFYSLRQKGTEPPSFVFQVNDPNLVHFSYRRYLENVLRQAFGFKGTPIKTQFHQRIRRKR